MEKIKPILDFFKLIGMPTLFACVIYFFRICCRFGKRIDILMNAQQKQMRRDLTQDYHRYMAAGHIDDDDLDMWEAAYQAYHALGVNGIMDNRREDLIKLNSETHRAEAVKGDNIA